MMNASSRSSSSKCSSYSFKDCASGMTMSDDIGRDSIPMYIRGSIPCRNQSEFGDHNKCVPLLLTDVERFIAVKLPGSSSFEQPHRGGCGPSPRRMADKSKRHFFCARRKSTGFIVSASGTYDWNIAFFQLPSTFVDSTRRASLQQTLPFETSKLAWQNEHIVSLRDQVDLGHVRRIS